MGHVRQRVRARAPDEDRRQCSQLLPASHPAHTEPIRGWADTCNAHPTDFFYTGFCTSPLSVLWLMPADSVHIVAIGACLWINSFVGSLGHCRLDFNIGVFNSRFHAGHHAYSKCNFAQNIELWDRLFGTYRSLNVESSKVRGRRHAMHARRSRSVRTAAARCAPTHARLSSERAHALLSQYKKTWGAGKVMSAHNTPSPAPAPAPDVRKSPRLSGKPKAL